MSLEVKENALRRQRHTGRYTGRRPWDDRGQDGNAAALSQGTPRMASHTQELAKGKEGFYPERKDGPAGILISDF